MQEQERAKYEVDVYENYIEFISSIHKECGEKWNWSDIVNSDPPQKPQLQNNNEALAQKKYDEYKPSLSDKFFRRVKRNIAAFEKDIKNAKEVDQQEYKKALDEYEIDLREWTKVTNLGRKICADDPSAYIEALTEFNPFEEIKNIGSGISFVCKSKNLMICDLHVHDEKTIPKEIKSLMKSGKLSVRPLPQSKYYDLYQDYVCGCVLRIAREIFALLPLETVIVNAKGDLLNKSSGHIENVTILSVAMPRKTIEILKFDTLDPSDSMNIFINHMGFKRSQGFYPVEDIKLQDISSFQNSI